MTPITCKCDGCNLPFELTIDQINEKLFDAKDQKFLLRYFTCPHCGKLYRIFIKDKKVFELEEDLKSTQESLEKLKQKGIYEGYRFKKTIDMICKKQKRLQSYSSRVQSKFEKGTFYLDYDYENKAQLYYHE